MLRFLIRTIFGLWRLLQRDAVIERCTYSDLSVYSAAIIWGPAIIRENTVTRCSKLWTLYQETLQIVRCSYVTRVENIRLETIYEKYVLNYFVYVFSCGFNKFSTAILIESLRKKFPYALFFWSVFSRSWAEYGKIRTRKTPNTGTFHAVSACG